MLSHSPFFIDSFIPTLSTYNAHGCRAEFQRPLVHNREPNYYLTENEQTACLQVELPGVAKENVKLHLTGNRMVLTAKRFSKKVVPDKEFSDKSNKDSAELKQNQNNDEEMASKPDDVPKPSVVYELKVRIGNRYDMESIEASMEGDGLLNLRIPTKRPPTPRNIEIQ